MLNWLNKPHNRNKSMSPQLDPNLEDQAGTARQLLGSLPERWGRMDIMSRTALVEVGRALREEGMFSEESPKLAPGWSGGMVVGSSRGSLSVDLEYAESLKAGPGMASPHLFGYTLPNIPLAEAAIQYGLTGPVFSLISDTPYEDALLEAKQWLQDMPGNKKVMVAGALDVIPSGESSEVIAKLKILKS